MSKYQLKRKTDTDFNDSFTWYRIETVIEETQLHER